MEAVSALLASGAEPNAKNERGETPLQSAVEDGSAEIIAALLEAEAALAQLPELSRSLIDVCPVVQLDRSAKGPAFMFRPATAKLRPTT